LTASATDVSLTSTITVTTVPEFNGRSLSNGAIGGIVAGVIVGLIVITLLAVIGFLRSRKYKSVQLEDLANAQLDSNMVVGPSINSINGTLVVGSPDPRERLPTPRSGRLESD
jgi:hypothetical protein